MFCPRVRTNSPIGRLSVFRVGPLLLSLLATLLVRSGFSQVSRDSTQWVGTWTAAATGSPPNAPIFHDETLRMIVHTSVAGKEVRIRLSNVFGRQPLVVGGAHLAIHATGSGIIQKSDRALTFSGQSSISVPPGAPVLSDPVQLEIPARTDLAVSVFLPGETRAATAHWNARQSSYAAHGNLVGAPTLPGASVMTFWPFLTGVDVAGYASLGAVAALGDSITDGDRSTQDGNARWPDILASRLLATRSIAVLNSGIAGNRILHDGTGQAGPTFGPSALARFDSDVLAQSGVKYVIVLEGINDIGQPGAGGAPRSEEVTSVEIIAGLRQLIERARERGLRVFGGTLLPFEGAAFPGYYSPEREATRQKVNEWIRRSGAFEAIIDFDQTLRDPSRPTRLRVRYDSGDHVHPNDAGYRAMGDVVDLSLFFRKRSD
jgi:lysophospholipase L1-like esterase